LNETSVSLIDNGWKAWHIDGIEAQQTSFKWRSIIILPCRDRNHDVDWGDQQAHCRFPPPATRWVAAIADFQLGSCFSAVPKPS
jgi:hypothetical protein